MLHAPATVERAMELADHTDSAIWFSPVGHRNSG